MPILKLEQKLLVKEEITEVPAGCNHNAILSGYEMETNQLALFIFTARGFGQTFIYLCDVSSQTIRHLMHVHRW